MTNVGLAAYIFLNFQIIGVSYKGWFCLQLQQEYVRECITAPPAPLKDPEGYDKCLRFEFEC